MTTSIDQIEHKYGMECFKMNGSTILMLCISRIMFSFLTREYADKKRYSLRIDRTGIRTRPLLQQEASIITFIE
jgi:hypothetical protein